MNDIKAAIFDLDGTLIDSMWVWEQIDIDYLESKGFTVPDNLKDEINHLGFEGTAHYFKKRFAIKEPIKEIMNTWHDMSIKHYAEDVELKKGVVEFLDYLKSKKIKIALATSNSYPLLEAVLKHRNIYNYFDCFTTTDEVGVSKNNPDIYLKSAEKLGVAPSECIVFEDIIEAIKGAKSANMKVAAVYDKSAEYQKEDIKKIADFYIQDFREMILKI